MMVVGFLDEFYKLVKLRFNNDDDFTDRLSRRYSVMLLLVFTIIVSTRQYVGERKIILISAK